MVFYTPLNNEKGISEADSGGGGARSCAPLFFFAITFLCNHIEELQTVLFEVELIINNAPLRYVYPNSFETCLTPNHFLFGI